MAPVGTRQSTRARAQRAALLKSVGYSWGQIAEAEGWHSRQAAQQAVARLEVRTPVENVETLRRREGDALRIVKVNLFERFADAKAAGDDDRVLAYAKELRCTSDAIVRLFGLAVPVTQKHEVDIHQTSTTIIAEATERLMAVIDGEFVEPKEIGA